MLVRPNLVVALVGVVVAASTGTYIGTHFKELTDIVVWRVDVTSDSEHQGYKSGQAPQGRETVVPWDIPRANVSRIQFRMTWQDSGGNPVAPARHEVTVSIRTPTGRLVAQSDPTTGGASGITLDEQVREVPEDRRFEGTEDQFASRYEREYTDHSEDRGRWNVTIKANAPQGGLGISYTMDLRIEYYTVAYEEGGPVPTGGVK